MENNLYSLLKQFALSVKKEVDDTTSKGIIRPDQEVYFKWKINKFKYTDKGVTERAARGVYFSKPSWLNAIFKLTKLIKESAGYTTIQEKLTKAFGEEVKLSQALEHFVVRLIREYLHNSKFGEDKIDMLIKTFLKDLRKEPVKYGAEVELQGIALRPMKIEIDYGVTLRQTRIEDLEREFQVYSFAQPHFFFTPSAILNIEFLGRGINEIQKRVEQTIAILRLFKVGSVKWTRYHMHSDSITDITANATLTSGKAETALETSLIKEEDVPRLKKFWQIIKNMIPRSFFDPDAADINYRTIAYNRYCDSLFQNRIVERRIANTVMGLEALFLKSDERQELIYRLKFRISKLFGLCGYNPHDIKELIRDAYEVRSLFAHGGHLGYKARKKIESKYRDINKFLQLLLEYLRMSIIIMMLNKKEKDEFIDLIDDSFIDRRQEEALNNIVSGIKNVIG